MSRCRWACDTVLILGSVHPGFLTLPGVNSCALAPSVPGCWTGEQPRVLSGCRGGDRGAILAASTWFDRDPLIPWLLGWGFPALRLAWALRPWLPAPLLARSTTAPAQPTQEPGLAFLIPRSRDLAVLCPGFCFNLSPRANGSAEAT